MNKNIINIILFSLFLSFSIAIEFTDEQVIELFNSKLNKNLVQKLIYTGNQSDIDSMFDNRTLDVK